MMTFSANQPPSLLPIVAERIVPFPSCQDPDTLPSRSASSQAYRPSGPVVRSRVARSESAKGVAIGSQECRVESQEPGGEETERLVSAGSRLLSLDSGRSLPLRKSLERATPPGYGRTGVELATPWQRKTTGSCVKWISRMMTSQWSAISLERTSLGGRQDRRLDPGGRHSPAVSSRRHPTA